MEGLTELEYVCFCFVFCFFLFTIFRSFFYYRNWLIISYYYFQATQCGELSLAAVWSDKGQVEIFDLKPQLEAVHSSAAMATFTQQQKEAMALFSFSGHMSEGFAIDWSPKVPGE